MYEYNAIRLGIILLGEERFAVFDLEKRSDLLVGTRSEPIPSNITLT
jgi:hypothetical protein